MERFEDAIYHEKKLHPGTLVHIDNTGTDWELYRIDEESGVGYLRRFEKGSDSPIKIREFLSVIKEHTDLENLKEREYTPTTPLEQEVLPPPRQREDDSRLHMAA